MYMCRSQTDVEKTKKRGFAKRGRQGEFQMEERESEFCRFFYILRSLSLSHTLSHSLPLSLSFTHTLYLSHSLNILFSLSLPSLFSLSLAFVFVVISFDIFSSAFSAGDFSCVFDVQNERDNASEKRKKVICLHFFTLLKNSFAERQKSQKSRITCFGRERESSI